FLVPCFPCVPFLLGFPLFLVSYCTTKKGGVGPARFPGQGAGFSPTAAARPEPPTRWSPIPECRPGVWACCPGARLPGAGTRPRRVPGLRWEPEHARWERPGMLPPPSAQHATPGRGVGDAGCGLRGGPERFGPNRPGPTVVERG